LRRRVVLVRIKGFARSVKLKLSSDEVTYSGGETGTRMSSKPRFVRMVANSQWKEWRTLTKISKAISGIIATLLIPIRHDPPSKTANRLVGSINLIFHNIKDATRLTNKNSEQ